MRIPRARGAVNKMMRDARRYANAQQKAYEREQKAREREKIRQQKAYEKKQRNHEREKNSQQKAYEKLQKQKIKEKILAKKVAAQKAFEIRCIEKKRIRNQIIEQVLNEGIQ